MSGDKFKLRFNERFDETRLKTIIHRTLEEKMPEGIEKSEREKCLDQAASRIIDAINSELFRTPDKIQVDIYDEDTKRGKLDQVTNRILADIKFGYLSSNLQMMMALGSAIAERDTGSSAHNYKVTLYAARLGEVVGHGKKQMRALIKGSFLHDIGKIGIPDRILLKESKLNEYEKITMNAHVQLGAHIIRDVKWLEDAIDIVKYHHERWDGTGYPGKVSGTDIPINARIFAIVDVFDALTSDRPYKPHITYDEAIEYMNWQSGRHFDPELFESFLYISERSYQDIIGRSYDELNGQIREMIDRHFDIDLNDEKIQTSHDIL
jgi:putative nucleotidyltransferase with HDIG domain